MINTVIKSTVCPLTNLKEYIDFMSKPHTLSFDGKDVGVVTGVRSWMPYPERPHYYIVEVDAVLSDEFEQSMRESYAEKHYSFENERKMI